jgi:hypothetical protein
VPRNGLRCVSQAALRQCLGQLRAISVLAALHLGELGQHSPAATVEVVEHSGASPLEQNPGSPKPILPRIGPRRCPSGSYVVAAIQPDGLDVLQTKPRFAANRRMCVARFVDDEVGHWSRRYGPGSKSTYRACPVGLIWRKPCAMRCGTGKG